MDFNPAASSVMHIDLNSAFASIEQQANPLFRGKPLVVAAYDSPGGCILASSIEAKRLGIKTGMRVKEAKNIFPRIIVLEPDPDKYRFVHKSLKKLLSHYTNELYPKSIDEFVLHFDNFPNRQKNLFSIALEIKSRIKKEIGDYLTVSIGVAPNRFLAKTASNLQKPDGLEEINKNNFFKIYQKLSLKDLCGINVGNEKRLLSVGIKRVPDFYKADRLVLKAAFRSVLADYWFLRLRGWEVDKLDLKRKSFGNSYALPNSNGGIKELIPLLQKLIEKTAFRMRKAGFKAQGITVSVVYKDRSFWYKSKILKKAVFDSREIYRESINLLYSSPHTKPVHTLAESCFFLTSYKSLQLDIFENIPKKKNLTKALDEINKKWGIFSITPARFILTKNKIKDRISFGGVREL